MSVHNISHLKSMTIHNGNMILIKYFKNYLADEKHNKMLGVSIPVSCFGSTPLETFCRTKCTGQ